MKLLLSKRSPVSWILSHFGGTAGALCQLGAGVFALAAGTALAATFWPRRAGYAVMWCVCLGAAELAVWLARRAGRRWLGRDPGWLAALGLVYGSAVYTVEQGAGEGWTYRVWLFAALAAGTLWLLTASWWSLLRHRRATPATVGAGLLSAGGTALLAVFLFTDGFSDSRAPAYLALNQNRDARLAELEPSLGMGPYTPAKLDYGPEGELEAGSVNLSPYMSRDTGDLVGNYVDVYWDYELTQAPLQGRVWYPEEAENCPVLFFAHGNHEITTASYLGYDYLGRYLASHGYVMVSVDQNACNMLAGENDGRAVLLLEHIGLLLEFNQERGGPLYGRMDGESIAIGGHSRGGEMVATACLFNGYDRYPENGAVEFDYGFPIKSIVAVAPTVDQYRPADHSVRLEDVNYLLLHGAADRDVSRFMGMTQYENISFTGEGDYLKTALYIGTANHGQFNELWGAYDQQGPFAPLLNVESLLSEEDQQAVARVFIKVFLDVTLRGDERCRRLLTDWDSCAGQLPETVYVQCWESSGFVPVADFEEDSDLETAAMEGAALSAQGAALWTEELVGFGGRDTHAARLRWRGEASYSVDMPQQDLTGRRVVFDLCDVDSRAVERGELELVDGEVVLTDRRGQTASARISDFAAVFPILAVRTDKLDFVFDTSTYQKAFATAAIPVEDFTAEGDFDPAAVTGIRLVFDGSGEILLDNIGIETYR